MFEEQSMINRLSNPINRNRSAAKISKVMRSSQYRSVLIDTWWYWVNMERYWLIYDGTGSAEGGTVRYLVVLGQKRVMLVDT